MRLCEARVKSGGKYGEVVITSAARRDIEGNAQTT